jgi:hypothetical protein
VIIREAMTMDIANVVEDYGSLLAWGWAQHAAHLLEVQAEGLRGPEQDGATGGGDVEAFGDDIDGHQNLHCAGVKFCNDTITIGRVAEECGRRDTGCIE